MSSNALSIGAWTREVSLADSNMQNANTTTTVCSGARLNCAADWLVSLSKRLDQIALLPDNWDSYGAAPVNGSSIRCAKRLLGELARAGNVPIPTVTAAPSGNVAFAWDGGNWSLDLTIDDTGLIEYVYLAANESDRESRTRNPRELIVLLSK